MVQTIKNLPAMQETQVQSLGQEDPLEKEMAIHLPGYSYLVFLGIHLLGILAWEIPWTEEPGGLQSIGSQRMGHD